MSSMKEKRHRLKEVTNILKNDGRPDEVETGYVVSDSELVVLDDVVIDSSQDLLFGEYQVDITYEE